MMCLKGADQFSGSSIGVEPFWALQDVCFEVKQGDVVGVIGKNGSGKSTLLKILSRIVVPTTGSVQIRGRVGSLLEVGTGFHPELTGRENIYLSGALIGMKRAEISRMFDSIVEFAGIDKFLETPVKHYSSGMYVRLAFSVASHLESEILLVDEVLAVGDTEFQKKCLEKIHAVTGEGRTVLLVSHNFAAISSICQKGLLLENGKLIYYGSVQNALSLYQDRNTYAGDVKHWTGNEGDDCVRLHRTWVASLHPSGQFCTSSDLEIGVEIEILREIEGLVLGFRLFSGFDTELAYLLHDDLEEGLPPTVMPGKMVRRFIIPANTLAEGDYRIGFAIGVHGVRAIILNTHGTLNFSLLNIAGIGKRYPVGNVRGFSSLFRPSWKRF
jgi:lipopolysaccharide transport system ATP-binding protein